jgi:hypothetical protein
LDLTSSRLTHLPVGLACVLISTLEEINNLALKIVMANPVPDEYNALKKACGVGRSVMFAPAARRKSVKLGLRRPYTKTMRSVLPN